MKTDTLFALIWFSLLTPPLFGQITTPAIPEEARKHFVAGTTLFKDAKTATDFLEAESEFKQAISLAPQWPDARYNLALAKEAAGDYSGAMADLKLYQQFKLSDTEARMVQDKIYALETKGKKQAGEQKVAAAEGQKKRDYESKIGFLVGRWNSRVIVDYRLLGIPDRVFDESFYHADIAIKNNQIVIKDVNDPNQTVEDTFYGKINGSDLDSIAWTSSSGKATEVTISPDHRHIRIYVPIKSLQGASVAHAKEIRLFR